MTPQEFEDGYAPGAKGQGHKWRCISGHVIDVTPSESVYTVECELCGLQLVVSGGDPHKTVQPCMEIIIV